MTRAPRVGQDLSTFGTPACWLKARLAETGGLRSERPPTTRFTESCGRPHYPFGYARNWVMGPEKAAYRGG